MTDHRHRCPCGVGVEDATFDLLCEEQAFIAGQPGTCFFEDQGAWCDAHLDGVGLLPAHGAVLLPKDRRLRLVYADDGGRVTLGDLSPVQAYLRLDERRAWCQDMLSGVFVSNDASGFGWRTNSGWTFYYFLEPECAPVTRDRLPQRMEVMR